ncbi:T9SS type A sorting domain-containing protein [Candidatus Dependentiae bacterium]|nr:T9SS type A sorting domain-containing protein [Candidatus Dependentiae bacterium]
MMKNLKLKFIFLMLLIPIFTFAELEVIPNPFNSDSETTTIIFTTHQEADVTIGIYNTDDILIRRLYSAFVSTGTISIEWDGRNDYSGLVEKGAYTVKVSKDQYPALAIPYGSNSHYGQDTAYNKGRIAIANALGHQVEIFSRHGQLLGRYGKYGTEVGEFYFPQGIAMDDDSNLFISDASGRIQRFNYTSFNVIVSGLNNTRGMDYFSTSLYVSTNLGIHKYNNLGGPLAQTGVLGDIPDLCAYKIPMFTETWVYYLRNDGPGSPVLFKIEDQGAAFGAPIVLPSTTLTDPHAKWASVSYDQRNELVYLLYTNESDNKFGIWVYNPTTDLIIDKFEILQISTTGLSIAVENSSCAHMPSDNNSLWVPGANVLNEFVHEPISNPGALNINTVFGNSSILMLWPGDIEVSPSGLVLAIDRGAYPQAKFIFPNFIDAEDIDVLTDLGTFSFSQCGTTVGTIWEATGIASLYNVNESQELYYVTVESNDIYANSDKLYRYNGAFEFEDSYLDINNPVGLTSFYTWLFTLEQSTSPPNNYQIVVIDTHINSSMATIATKYSYLPNSGFGEPTITNPVDIAVDYIGIIYVLQEEEVHQFRMIPEGESISIVYITDLQLPSEFGNDFSAIAVDSFGNIYVYNDFNGRILIFNRNGEFLKDLGGGIGWEPGQFNRVEGMDFDEEGNLWISDSANHRFQIIVFNYRGTEQETVVITDNPGIPFVSTFSISKPEPVIAGDLEITIGFSEGMDMEYPPEVLLIDGKYGNTHTVTMNEFKLNKWSGDITIYPRTGNGMATVLIRNARDLDGHYIVDTERKFKINTDVSDVISNLTNYPNPFSPLKKPTRIEYYLNQHSYVTLEIFDLSGRLVRSQKFSPGQLGGREGFENYFEWDGRTDSGTMIQNGVYILRVTAKGLKSSEKKVIKRKIAVMK